MTLASFATFGLLLAAASAQPELPPVQIPPNFQDQIPPQPANGGPIPDLQPNEVLTRGPVHEAFAQPADAKIEAALTIKQQPPDPLPEVPPEVRPEDENAQWIPGYWSYDPDQNQFIWVSGVYRVSPPNRVFVPGHWANTPDGWTWIPGFWAPRAESESYYLPEPPAPKEEEPQVAGPEDSFYVPGNWVYVETQYQWRPGYYARYRADRIWVPARYLWTPSGYLFVPGYWDYPLERRGLLFAPVAFQQNYWRNPGWRYQPRYVVNFNLLFGSLFARPAAGHFYFGDYYGANYTRLGYRPWFDRRYDPLFAYYRYENRANPNWATGIRQTFNDRAAGRGFIPPRTLAEQTKIVNQSTTVNNTTINNIRMIAPVDQSTTTNNVKITTVDQNRAKVQDERIRQFREMQTLRTQTEKPATGGKNADPKTRPQSLKIINTATAGGGNTGTGGNVGKEPKTVQPKSIDPKTVEPKVLNPKTVETKKVIPKAVDPMPKVDSNPIPKKEFPKRNDPTPQPKIDIPKREFPKQIDPPLPRKQIDPVPQPKFESPKKEIPKFVNPTPKFNPTPRVDPTPKKEFPKFVEPVPQPKVNPQPKAKFDPPPVREVPKFQPPMLQPKSQPTPAREVPKASPKADPPGKKKDGGRQASLNFSAPRQTFVRSALTPTMRSQPASNAGRAATKGRRR
ncbi:MAG: hypothetical protein U0744_03380 [Gemmataceae bacterium]